MGVPMKLIFGIEADFCKKEYPTPSVQSWPPGSPVNKAQQAIFSYWLLLSKAETNKAEIRAQAPDFVLETNI